MLADTTAVPLLVGPTHNVRSGPTRTEVAGQVQQALAAGMYVGNGGEELARPDGTQDVDAREDGSVPGRDISSTVRESGVAVTIRTADYSTCCADDALKSLIDVLRGPVAARRGLAVQL
jgi:hypothetical protein